MVCVCVFGGEVNRFIIAWFPWVFFLVNIVGTNLKRSFPIFDEVSLRGKNSGSVSGAGATKQIHSRPIISQGVLPKVRFFVSNISWGPARCLQNIQAASEAAVFPTPLKSYLCLGYFGSAFPQSRPLAFASRDLP